MKDERYKELMDNVGLPNSHVLLQALQQCSMESALEERNNLMKEYHRLYEDGKTPTAQDVAKVFADVGWGCHSLPNAAGQGRRVATYPEPDGSALDYEPQDREERCDQCGTFSGCLMNGLCPMCYELNGGTHE